tara:strand:- start:10794 stop:11219 length:426 start_codon:yes stop_codon:yes gene_type:complete
MPLIGREAVGSAIQNAKINANKDVRGVYFSGLSAVIKQTPVDEGRARNNWFLTEGVASDQATTSNSDSGSNSFSQLNSIPKNVLDKKIYFTNNLPYIEVLEYGGYPNPNKGIKTAGGFSKQAPSGWVRKTLISMQNKIRSL